MNLVRESALQDSRGSTPCAGDLTIRTSAVHGARSVTAPCPDTVSLEAPGEKPDWIESVKTEKRDKKTGAAGEEPLAAGRV